MSGIKDGGVRSAQDYIILQELASSSRLLTAGSEGWQQPRQLRGMLCASIDFTAHQGEWMSQRSKEEKKEALFEEQMGYLHSGVQVSMMPKATGT